jgi:DNA-binding CsgD family transcriptional regulator
MTQSLIYRRTFVGREAELHQLEAAFDDAAAGRAALIVVVGEPGVGKSALCEQLADSVMARGGCTLVGHCYEEGSLSLPYLAFVEALRSYVLSRPPETLRDELGSGAPDVARIVSEVRERLSIEARPPGGDPDEQRWRLWQAVSGFFHRASQVQPLLLVLEDVHWADKGTLELLLHLARNLAGARLLIVGTYRDLEVDRAHPLSAVLAELRRATSFGRVALGGLSSDEVQRMIQVITGQEVRPAFAEAVHRQTEGNPLFVEEVLRYLVEDGHLAHEGGRWQRVSEMPPEFHIPRGLWDVIGKRLARLSSACSGLLPLAAVIGREFRLDTLKLVAGLAEDSVIAALEEATRVGVLEEQARVGPVGYRFAHALFRQSLYEELSAPRRVRVHQEVAWALEQQYAGRTDAHAAELAEHYAHASDSEDLEKAVRYGELAAQQAMAVYAYGEAVRLLERALAVQGVLDPDDHIKRCDLLLELGEAMLPSEESKRAATQVAPEAFALAELVGDARRAARAAVLALEALLRAGGSSTSTIWESVEFKEWATRADRSAVEGTADRVYADVYLGLSYHTTHGPIAAHPLLRRAVVQARDLDDSQAFFLAAAHGLGRLNALQDREVQQQLADEFLSRAHERTRSVHVGLGLRFAVDVLLERGDRVGAEQLWRELRELAERTRDRMLAVMVLEVEELLAVVDGRLEEALATFAAHEASTDEFRGGVGTPGNYRLWARVLIWLGRGDESLIRTEDPARGIQATRAMCLAHLGRHAEARAIREQFGDVGSDQDESSTGVVAHLLEAAILGGDRETAQALARRLAPLAQFPCSKGGAASFARLLGGAAVLLGERAQAQAYYEQALEVCTKIGFRPEIALTHLQLAELLLGDGAGTSAEALTHLDFAIEELHAMGMQPALERALGLREDQRRAAASRSRPAFPGGLSEREVEVVRLVAAGKTNQQIADELVISLNTVVRHISNIFSKIGAANRVEAAAYASRHGLLA